jgi:hypothetical protein
LPATFSLCMFSLNAACWQSALNIAGLTSFKGF